MALVRLVCFYFACMHLKGFCARETCTVLQLMYFVLKNWSFVDCVYTNLFTYVTDASLVLFSTLNKTTQMELSHSLM